MSFFIYENKPLPNFPEKTTGYDDLTSLWLAHCAALAYQSKLVVARELKGVGFDRVTFFDNGGTNAYFAEHPGYPGGTSFGIVAFRGTENDYTDILADVTFFKRTLDYDRGYRAHGGFLSSLGQVWGAQYNFGDLNDDTFAAMSVGAPGLVEAVFKRVRRSDPDRLYFTGHSLGGGLATLAAYNYNLIEPGQITALYTIGSPRAGGVHYARALNDKPEYETYRIYNASDIVPKVPPLILGFQHVGVPVYLKRDGSKVLNASYLTALLDVGLRQGLVLIGTFLLFVLLFGWLLDYFSDIELPHARYALAVVLTTVVFMFSGKLLQFLPFRIAEALRLSIFTDHGSSQYLGKLARL